MISTLLTACAFLAASPGRFDDLLKPLQYHYTGGRYNNELIRYRLFSPRTLQAKERDPLVVWFHGYGDAGDSDQWHISHIDVLVDYPNQDRKGQFYLLAVRCPSSNPSWFQESCAAHSASGDDMVTVAYDVIKKVMQKHPVDEKRIYLSGVSSGGNGCWEMAMRYPSLFATVVPMSSAGGDTSRAASLKDIPIWAFHNAEDTQPTPEGVEATAAAVAAAGGNIHLTLTPHVDWTHDSWTVAMKKYDILTWMLAQRRGGLCVTPPGCRPWKWRHILAMPAAFLAIAWLAWMREKRKHRARQDDEADFILCLPNESKSNMKEDNR